MSALRMAAVAAALILAARAPAGSQPANAADASAWAQLPASRVRLVASPAEKGARSYRAGLEVLMEEGWKTYWRTPGDAGVPPTFDWTGSANAAAIEVSYPAPVRMPEAGGEVIGYKGAVLFPIKVTPQDAAGPVLLKLALEYGICREICIPATATLELSLPPAGTGGHAAAIEAALERVPRPQSSRRKTDPELRRVAVDDDGSRLTIEAAFHGGKGADVFVEAPEGLYVPLPRKLAEQAGGIVRYGIDLSPDLARDLRGKTLTFTLVSEAGASEAKWTFP
jgi:DsbC/DsbD-like thiol-disulfide interchange protein